jgi:ABC-type polysaccharide/polyol phosphate transport system ATPase subunit
VTDIAIQVEKISKRFRIDIAPRPTMLKEAITQGIRRLAGRSSGKTRDVVWALRDVSFEVPEGQALGIVGGNGAGKSTLLKILSRITEPTEGHAWVRGRVGSLLEVGTGFHGELTGRENLYLNGAILGMRQREIRRKFDQIVAFAGVERFIDTPVKHYSSGMYLRLAFSVAAHLEAEILIVDEVLAVGDAEFQQRCMGRMSEVTHGGRTVLFVSHNLEAVQRLCSTCLLLDGGRLIASGATEDVVRAYIARWRSTARPGDWIDLTRHPRSGNGEAKLLAARFSDGQGRDAIRSGSSLDISLSVLSPSRQRIDSVSARLSDPNGTCLVNADTAKQGQSVQLAPGLNEIVLHVEALHLNPGSYLAGFALVANGGHTILDRVDSAFELSVEPDGAFGYGGTLEHEGFVPCRLERVSVRRQIEASEEI